MWKHEKMAKRKHIEKQHKENRNRQREKEKNVSTFCQDYSLNRYPKRQMWQERWQQRRKEMRLICSKEDDGKTTANLKELITKHEPNMTETLLKTLEKHWKT